MKALASLSILLTLAAAAAAAVPQAGSTAVAKLDGKALYHEKCAMCHNQTGMGTGLLSRRVKVAELALRTDLTADFVIQAARAGIGNMPAIPRGEASDEQLQAIARYLATPPAARQ